VAAPKVLERVKLAGKIVTADAMHTQRAISAYIVEQNGDYLWPVKENQERLYQDIHHLFAPDQPKPGFGKLQTDFQCAEKVNCGHGRIEKRLIRTSSMLNEYLDWPGVEQVYYLERQFIWMRQGQAYKTSQEVEVGITSLSRTKAPPERVLALRRQHWQIETGLHYRRDVTFHEDATRTTIDQSGSILSMVHNLVIALIKRPGSRIRLKDAGGLLATFRKPSIYLLHDFLFFFEKAMRARPTFLDMSLILGYTDWSDPDNSAGNAERTPSCS